MITAFATTTLLCAFLAALLVRQRAVASKAKRRNAQLEHAVETYRTQLARYRRLVGVLQFGQQGTDAEAAIDRFIDSSIAITSATSDQNEIRLITLVLRRRFERLPANLERESKPTLVVRPRAKILRFERT